MLARFLCLSLLLHLFLMARLPRYPVDSPRPVTVELEGQLPKRSEKKPGRPGPSLSELGIRWGGKGSFLVPKGLEEGTMVPAAGDETEGGFGGLGGGRLLAVMGGTVAHHYVYNRIEEALDYPLALREARIEGVVKVVLTFTADGAVEPRRCRFESKSSYLRVHVRRVLKEAFRDPLPQICTRRGPLKVHCLFAFDLVRRDSGESFGALATSYKMNFRETADALGGIGAQKALSDSPQVRQGVMGDRLAFYRAGKHLGEWKVGPIGGFGLAPAVGIDLGWIEDRVTGLVTSKAPPDPLAPFRREEAW